MSLAVYHLAEGEWLVRGTTDVKEATDVLLADTEVLDYCDGYAEDCDLEGVAPVIRAGLFRFSPCSPRSCGEHGWHLGYAGGPGRGVFPGVYFDSVHFREVTYDDGFLDQSAEPRA